MIARWVRRSLFFYRLHHLLFATTVALTAALLSAALMTGESLKQGLRQGLTARLGAIRSSVYLETGLFPVSLATRLPQTQAGLLLNGELLSDEETVCAGRVQILGDPTYTNRLSAGWPARLNARARAILPKATGALRFVKPSPLPLELPLGSGDALKITRRAIRVVEPSPNEAEASLLTSSFALQVDSVPPVTLRVPYTLLAGAAEVSGMANLLVSKMSPSALQQALSSEWEAEDAGLVLRDIPMLQAHGEAELREGTQSEETIITSARVYLPSGLDEVFSKKGLKSARGLFHLVDSFEAFGTRASEASTTNARVAESTQQTTPYGFVGAFTPGDGVVPADLENDEIVINTWLAEKLGVTTNGVLTLVWRRFEEGGRLVPDRREFRIRRIIDMPVAAAEKRGMPIFPGLADADRCATWDVGLPMDEEKLNDAANEAYWQQWRETPKAFLTYAAGTNCFGTLFGDTMRLHVWAGEKPVRQALKHLSPERVGLSVRPIWQEGLLAAQGATDFRLLFLGMTFMLIISALLLSTLSLALALETRVAEVALLSALGWSRSKIVTMLAVEWGTPVVGGALMGSALGATLAQALVWGLGRFWRDAFAGAETAFHFSWSAAGWAVLAAVVLSGGVLVRTLSRLAVSHPAGLWQGAGAQLLARQERTTGVGLVWQSVMGGGMALAAIGLMALASKGRAPNSIFFGAGFLLVLSILLFLKCVAVHWVARVDRSRLGQDGQPPSAAGPISAGILRAALNLGQSATVVLLLAVGSFLAIGMLAMKHDPAANSGQTWSGSGGFAALVTSANAMTRDHGLAMARRVTGAQGVIPIRVHEGDNAGCLNMSVPQQPRLLGVDARAMARLRAFEPKDAGGVWHCLEEPLPDGTLPGLAADEAMLQYSLKAKADPQEGQVLRYAGVGGKVWRIRLVGAIPVRSSILQGGILVDERHFMQMFPGEGYHLWLCDYVPYLLREAADQATKDKHEESLAVRRLRHPEAGVSVETVIERLRLLASVESTYLDMFLVFGGLGVVLGVVGVGLVILRSVVARRGELALLSALGISRGCIVRLLLSEYGVLVLSGLLAGVMPALVAIQPTARALHSAIPWNSVFGLVFGFFGSALLCVSLAAWLAAGRYGPAVLKEAT